jgi:predicted Zn-dependent protease
MVLLKLDASQQQTSKQLRSANRKNNLDEALDLATEFVALGRAQHDERYFGYASAALQPWRDDSASIEVLLLRADIAQHQHRFSDARTHLDNLLRREPTHLNARLMRAALHMTQAQPQAAAQDCQKLFALRESFAATVCLAHAQSMQGKLAESYRLIDALLGQGTFERRDAQFVWALSVAADMAERLGDREAAGQWLHRALSIDANNLVARLDLCDLLLSQKRPRAALDLLEKLPSSDPILLRRALAEQQVGAAPRSSLAEWRAAVERSEQLGIALHLRELARGQLQLLNEPHLALKTALKNWEVQREPVDVRLLVDAAHAANNPSVLEQVREWQRTLRFEDRGVEL